MELLPNLSPAQADFAREYFAVFSHLKSAVLIFAGAALLAEHTPDRENDLFAENCRMALREAFSARDRWNDFDPAATTCQDDHLRIKSDIQTIIEAVETFSAARAKGSNADKATLTDTVIRSFASLREIALQYWRLELVPESAHHHHVHDEDLH